jgi:hypothetical protein
MEVSIRMKPSNVSLQGRRQMGMKRLDFFSRPSEAGESVVVNPYPLLDAGSVLRLSEKWTNGNGAKVCPGGGVAAAGAGEGEHWFTMKGGRPVQAAVAIAAWHYVGCCAAGNDVRGI